MRSDMPGLLPRVLVAEVQSSSSLQIVVLLAGKPGGRAVALELGEMAARAADRGGRALRLGGDVIRRRGCCRSGHFKLGEVGGERR